MSYRIARSTLALTIIIITFATSCDAQITDETLSSAGKKFVVGFPRNSGQRADELFLFITNPESSAVNFTVSLINISGNVSTSSTRVNVPPSFEVFSVNERNKGILVEADGNINLYGMSFHQYTADAYLALPCSKMAVDEYEYYGISYDTISSTTYYPSVILLVACENETVVKFNSSTISINSMETYQIESDNDLTGTRITSSKPLSVFSGSDCANVPQGIRYCDHLVEQVPPTVTWGSKFLVASLEGRSSGERIRVLSARAASVAVNCNTIVSVSEFQLQSGGSFREFEIPINSFCSIESTSPVLVAQYAYGKVSDGFGVGDPFMMIIPPIEQFTNNYFVEAFPIFVSNYVTVYVSSEFFQTAQIVLDNSIVTGWRNVVCSSGEICGHISRINVSSGAHFIRHQNSSAVIGVSVYGFGVTNSYGYPGGIRLSPIQCNCGQNSICLNKMGQFNCSCLNGFVASLSTIDELICSAITCPPLTAPINGFVTYNNISDKNGNYSFNTMANHSCDTGFVLVGNNTRTCTGDGSSTTGVFDGEAAFCEPITCPPLTAPTNGFMTYSSSTSDENGNYAFNAMANHSCDTGFVLVGNNTRTCTGDGSSNTGGFDGEAPFCESITCPPLTAPTNGFVTYSSSTSDENGNYTFNAMANHSCDTGFVLVGNNTRTCTGDSSSTTGVFDGEAAFCEPITCLPLTALINGFVTYSSSTSDENGNYDFNAMANHSCDTGFVLIGKNTRTCTGDGSSNTGGFDGEAPFCELTCVLPAPPLNGVLLTNAQNTDQTESSVITFQCDPGFSLVGTETGTCNNSGLWDPDPALLECAAITGVWYIAALSGGFVAIVVVLILLVVIFLLVLTIRKTNRQLSGNEVPIAPAGPVYEEVDLAMKNRQISDNEVPIAPADPVYEEVDIAMIPRTQDIQLESNEAYGQMAKHY